MGQKVHPLIQRIGINKTWESLWFARKSDFAANLHEDIKIRKHIKKKFYQAAIAHIIIERLASRTKIRIRTARPGMIIGRRGVDIEKLRDDLQGILKREVGIDIVEIKNTFLEAQLVSENIALQLEKRIAFRRAMKRAIEQSINAGAKGIKVMCSGRLGGQEMSRKESYKRGKIPLQTFRADIDYGFTEAKTTYGRIGIKTWIYKGDTILRKKDVSEEKTVS